jgi:hypothetical protein
MYNHCVLGFIKLIVKSFGIIPIYWQVSSIQNIWHAHQIQTWLGVHI